jgi:hypothetical protein
VPPPAPAGGFFYNEAAIRSCTISLIISALLNSMPKSMLPSLPQKKQGCNILVEKKNLSKLAG